MGVLKEKEQSRTVEVKEYCPQIQVELRNKGDSRGYGLIVALSLDEYLMVGSVRLHRRR